jgi:uncharacterized RDD family membrane protein YckC
MDADLLVEFLDATRGQGMQQPPPLPHVNPYAAPAARVEDVGAAAEYELADRGTRLGAAILDGLVVGGPVALVAIGAAIMLPAMQRSGGESDRMAMLGVIGLLVGAALIGVLALNLVWLHRYGQSIAKRWLGIRIVRTDGGRCSLLRIIFARWVPMIVLRAIPLLGWIFGLIDALLIFREDYRCLHDHFADTIVVKA